MKSSRFNISTNSPELHQTILFNTLYGSTALIDDTDLPGLQHILENPSSALSEHKSKLFSSLVKGKFIINDEIDELDIVRNRKQCGIKDRNRADIIIMPNMDCNFACPYCYEKHDHSNRITPDVEASIIKWLESVIGSHKVVLLSWFGGEPLLSYKTIISIGAFAQKLCKKLDVSLISNITTNGFALNKKMIDQLVSLDIFNYQITVDGPPEVHNRTRVLTSGKGTFDRIQSNILLLAKADKRVKISLRVNYNHKNLHFIPELLKLFPESIRPQLRIVFEPIFGSAELSATKNISAQEISTAITKYYDLARALGFDVVLGGLGVGKLAYCYAEREDQFILNYNGDVFKCSVSDFSSSKRVGYIDQHGELIRETDKWNAWFDMELFEDDCENCTFLPLCMGGCRKDRIENGRTGSYCNLVPTNTSHALKSIAFNSFNQLLEREVAARLPCARKEPTSLGRVSLK